MVYVVNVLGELKSLDLGLEMVAGDCYPSWFCATVVLGISVGAYETKHWATVSMRTTISYHSFELFWRQFYWFQSSRLKLHFTPSSLEADEVNGDFSFCKTGHIDAGDWSCGSWGEFVLLLHDVLLRLAYNRFLLTSLVLCTPGASSLVSDWAHSHVIEWRTSCTSAMGPFGHSLCGYLSCKLCTLVLAKICVQENSLRDWLCTSKGGVEM